MYSCVQELLDFDLIINDKLDLMINRIIKKKDFFVFFSHSKIETVHRCLACFI